MKRIDITGVIGWEFTTDDLRRLLGSGDEPAVINVYSPGGDVVEGLEMYNIIYDYEGEVTVRLGALAASAATVFPMAADKVIARKTTVALIHKAWMFMVGNADDLRKESDWLDGFDGILAGIYAGRTGKKKAAILADMSDDKWLFGGDELVSYGLADEVTEDMSDMPDEAENEKTEEEAEQIIIEMQNKLRDKQPSDEQRERIAAMMPKHKGIFGALAQRPSHKKQATAPVGSEDKSITREESMNLSEFLEKNPEAKADVDALVAQKAEAMKPDEAKIRAEAIAKDRENQSKLLTAMGLRLSDEQKKAFTAGEDAGAYALRVLEGQQAKAPKPNANAIGGIAPAPEPQKEAESVEEAERKSSADAWDRLYGKKEEK